MTEARAAVGWWMGAAFVAAAVLAAVTLAVYGTSARAANAALMVTGRFSFLLFWLAYAGGGLAVILAAFPAPAAQGGILAVGQFLKHGREFGLAFASAHLVHIGVVGWLVWIGAPPGREVVVFFVPPLLVVYLLALFSVPALQQRLGRGLWATLRTAGMTYIAYAFAADFLVDPLSDDVKHLIEYSPFAIMSVAGPLLHLLALLSPPWRNRQVATDVAVQRCDATSFSSSFDVRFGIGRKTSAADASGPAFHRSASETTTAESEPGEFAPKAAKSTRI